jgi:hypothetical protein
MSLRNGCPPFPGQIAENFVRLDLVADFTKLGQRFHKVADKRFAKSWTTDAIEFRLPCCCYG